MNSKTRSAMRPDILSVSGHYFNFTTPEHANINIYDIATGLSNVCRFAGQLETFYSVAQHCVIVSKIVPRACALEGLMHDSAEAFIGDVTRPLKNILADYKIVEERVEASIMSQFGVMYPFPSCVKEADVIALATEDRDIAPRHSDRWEYLEGAEPLKERVIPLSPTAAKWLFLNRYDTITCGRNVSMLETYLRYKGSDNEFQFFLKIRSLWHNPMRWWSSLCTA